MAEDYREHDDADMEKLDVFPFFVRSGKTILRTWWLFFLIFALLFGAYYFYTKKLHTDKYQAYASFAVNVSGESNGLSSFNTTVSLKQLRATFPFILESGTLKKVIMEDLGTSWLPVTISADVIEDTNLFQIRVEGSDPALCGRVLDSLIENYPRVSRYVIGDIRLQMLDYSGAPEAPYNAISLRRLLRRSLFYALAVYIAIAIITTSLRRTVEHEDDLKQYTSLRCLSVIPWISLKRRSGKETRMLIDERSVPQAYKEAVNLLRIRVLREMDKKEEQVLLVTSTGESEGKSSVAANLALSVAQKGFRVLLIDGDLRNPNIALKFGIGNAGGGLSDVLKNRVDPDQALVRYKDTGLMLLPGGKRTASAEIARLLRKEKTDVLICEFRKRFDYIIIDSPPSGLMQDALILTGVSDCVLPVVRQDYLSRNRIAEMLNMLSETGIEMTGYVINGDSGNVGSYGYGHYGYGQGYGYGKYGKG